MPAGRCGPLALALIGVLATSTAASAHRRDEYLHASRLAVEPGRVEIELDLTPGITLAHAAIAEVDADGDGVLSEAEGRAYARRVVDRVVVEIDGRSLHVDAARATLPHLDDVRHGEGTIRVDAIVTLTSQSPGDHHLSFRNLDHQEGSVYLVNALVPRSDRIVVTGQHRDPEQRSLIIDYVVCPEPAAPAAPWALGALAGMAVVAARLMRPKNLA